VAGLRTAGLTLATIVITGATGAVGGAAVNSITDAGHRVVLLGRDVSRLSRASPSVASSPPGSAVETVVCDLASLESVRQAAAELLRRFPRVDALVHSAAVFLPDRKVTPEGLEIMLATHHLGPFLLTHLLLDRLRSSPPARVITVSAPSTSEMDFGDLQGERKWSALTQFGRTKMANLLFAYGLARREPASQLTSNVLFPGLVKSGLMKNANAAVRGLSGLMSRSPEAAGTALAWLATDPAVGGVSGTFFKLSKPDDSNAYSRDPSHQDRLWTLSAHLVGLPETFETSP
jgi:NAD(P)-dependent dehydrogenase (short-subunit alcohol dehydrogenase family)